MYSSPFIRMCIGVLLVALGMFALMPLVGTLYK